MRVPKAECQDCFSRRRVAVSFVEPHKQHPRAFERYVVELLRFMTPQDVSRQLGISWDLANDIQKGRLKRKFGRPKLKYLKRLAVDEVYVGKRQKGLTLVLDLDFGAVVFVGAGRERWIRTWPVAYSKRCGTFCPKPVRCWTGSTWSSCSTRS